MIGLVLPLLLVTLTTQFSLNCKWRSCKRNQNAVFTRSLSPTLLITTPTLTPSLLKPALTVTITGSPSSVWELMYQSIPAAPPPPGYCGAFAHLISPKGGALAILRSPGVWHLPIPGPALIFWHAGGFLSRSIPILYPESPGFLVSGGTPVGKWKFALPENLGIWSYCACLSSKWKWKWQFSRKPKVDSFSNNCTHDFFNDNWYSLVSSETERWFECLWALWFKFLFCVHDFCPIFSVWWFKMFILRLRCSGCKESIFTSPLTYFY